MSGTSQSQPHASMPVKVAASLAMTALLATGLVAGVSDDAYATACDVGDQPSGDGSVGDPWQIATKDNLLWVSWVTSADRSGDGDEPSQTDALADSYLQTTNTIDLEDCEWSPIGDRTNKFVGSFDGGGFNVSGLLVAQNEKDAGLFGVTENATLKNLTLVAAEVTATRTASTDDADDDVFYAGALVGDAQGSTVIEDIVVNGGTVDAPIAGGLAGKSGGSITDSESSATVSSGSSTNYNADFSAGGLVGANAGTVTGSDASGAVTSYDEAAGGFVGRNLTGAEITTSTASGAVQTEAGDNAGGFAGENDGTIKTSGATGNVASGDDRAGGFVGDNDGVIENCSASGTAQTVVNSDPDDSSDDAGGFAGRNSGNGVIRNSSASGNATSADGENAGGFVGENEGQIFDSSASGSATAATDNAGGFAGWMDSSDSRVERSHATGDAEAGTNIAGGFVGLNEGTVTDSSASGSADAGSFNAGGFVGRNEGTVEGSSASGAAGANNDAGGFAGRNWTSGVIEESEASGAATAVLFSAGGFVGRNWGEIDASSSSGNARADDSSAGGFVGTLAVDSGVSGSVTNSFASGDANTGNDRAGGFVGRLVAGEVSNSFATGSATATGDNAGGFVGQNDGGTVSSSYALGTAVAGGGTVGGFAAVNDDTIDDSFWDTETSALNSSAGGTGKTTGEMKSIATYNDTATDGLDTAWSIVAATTVRDPASTPYTWGIGPGLNGGYPFLCWQSEFSGKCGVAPANESSPRERQASAPAIHLDLQADVGDGAVGAPVVIGGQGLAPGSTMTLVVRSTPQTLETGQVSSLGNFSSEVSLPALPAGTHTLTLTGISPGGSTLSLVQSFTVAPNGVITALDATSGTQVGGLAATGPGDQLQSWGLAVVALLLGGLLLSGAAVRRNARLTR